MKKDRNRESDENRRDQTLPRSRILRGRDNFRRLFESGSVLHAPSLQFRYRLSEEPDKELRIGFIARKRLGNAVERNRTKRRMREAFRRQQHRLSDLTAGYSTGIHGVFMAKKPGLSYQEIQSEMEQLIGKLDRQLSRRQGSGNDRKPGNRAG